MSPETWDGRVPRTLRMRLVSPLRRVEVGEDVTVEINGTEYRVPVVSAIDDGSVQRILVASRFGNVEVSLVSPEPAGD